MNRHEQKFVDTVWEHYRQHGRHDLPWRQHNDTYRILVSEVMLQQTQVVRVREKYRQFLKAFPNTKALANASLGEVLLLWQGLGYNRRAKLLWECAKQVHTKRRGRWPRRFEELLALPGIGPYTAGAVMAFAYNRGVPIIETNIRAVYIHHFFHEETDVSEAAILRLVERTLPQGHAREWYWALMDYGAYLKQSTENPSRRAQAYVRQGTFAGSTRQLRGAILRALVLEPLTLHGLSTAISGFNNADIRLQLARLMREGFVARTGRRYTVPH